jgi:hypothetical protein
MGIFKFQNQNLKRPYLSAKNFIFKFISKNQLQVLIGHLIFLHKAVKPARVFVNRILALLRKMGDAPKAAIEGTKQDLQWCMAFAHAAKGTVLIYKCLLPRLDIFWFRGALNNYVYELSISHQPGYCIAHWESINILVALCTFAPFLAHYQVTIWCDNTVAVSILNSGRGIDPLLHTIARNIWLWEASSDCEIFFAHVRGNLNNIADLLSRLTVTANPVPKLFNLLNAVPLWIQPPSDVLYLNTNI